MSARPSEGPPPAHRWPERDPDAATRLTAVRAVVAALADEHHLPAENLLPPDAVRRLAWQPPEPVSPETVAAGLAGYGARPWQVELTSLPIARALLRITEKGGRGVRPGTAKAHGAQVPQHRGQGEGQALRRSDPSSHGAAEPGPQHPGAGQDLVALGVVGKDIEDHFAVAAAAAAPLHALHQAAGPRAPAGHASAPSTGACRRSRTR